jgi:hypothetical protein
LEGEGASFLVVSDEDGASFLVVSDEDGGAASVTEPGLDGGGGGGARTGKGGGTVGDEVTAGVGADKGTEVVTGADTGVREGDVAAPAELVGFGCAGLGTSSTFESSATGSEFTPSLSFACAILEAIKATKCRDIKEVQKYILERILTYNFVYPLLA